MASNANPRNPPDDNPYFANHPSAAAETPDITQRTPAPVASRNVSHGNRNAAPATPSREHPPALSRPRPAQNGAGSATRQQSSIGLRTLRARPSQAAMRPAANDWQRLNEQSDGESTQGPKDSRGADGRRRSTSEPQRPTWLNESCPSANGDSQHLDPVPEGAEGATNRRGGLFSAARRGSWLHRFPSRQQQPSQQDRPQDQHSLQEAEQQLEYDSRIVDLLDVVDPEVSTLTSMTNLQNSLFIPSLGRFVNRRPTYDISWAPPNANAPGAQQGSLQDISEEPRRRTTGDRPASAAGRAYSITSNVESTHYAVLPHGASLEGWSKEDVDRLNDHVRHMMHSRRSKFKRSLKGFGRYVSRPLGFLVTLYGTLITLFGLAWVLFLIGWIYVGEKQLYIINIIDYTLVALFAIVGDGLAPFRAVDTYHMIYIAHYHRISWILRRKLLLPDLRDHNDLPTEPVLPDVEAALETASLPSLAPGEEISVLTPQQQDKLTHHQTKYAKSHTFYRPHETETHFAFPLKLLVTITLLLDLHSCLQISLGACTYGIPYDSRPAALTTVILCCSITANATAGLLIWVGDRRTRKKDVIERMTRQELTEEAMQKVKKDAEKEAEKEAEREAARNEGNEEGRKSLSLPSLPRLSLDKVAGNLGSKKGESSSHKEKNVLREDAEEP